MTKKMGDCFAIKSDTGKRYARNCIAFGNGIKIFLPVYTVYCIIVGGFLTLQFDLKLHPIIIVAFTMTTGLAIALPATLSVAFRCVMCLCLPQAISDVGRKLILFLLIITVLNYPMQNIMANLQHMTDALAASKKELQEQMRDVQAVIQDSAEQVLKELVVVVHGIGDFLDDVDKILQPIKYFYDDSLASIRKLNVDCEETIQDVHNRCNNALESLCTNSFVKMFSLDSACRKVSEVCKIFTLDQLCNVLGGFANLFEEDKDIQNFFKAMEQFSKINVTVNQHVDENYNVNEIAVKIRKAAAEEFEYWEKNYEYYLHVLRYVLALSILLIPISAFLYFLSLRKDNSEMVDEVESENLKTREKLVKKLKDKRRKKHSQGVRVKKLKKKLLPILATLALFIAMILLEYVVFVASSIMKKVSNETVSVSAHILFDLGVTNAEVLGEETAKALNNFKINKTIGINVNVSLKEPVPPSGWGVIFGGLFGISVMAVTVVVEKWVMQKRLWVARKFYPEASEQ